MHGLYQFCGFIFIFIFLDFHRFFRFQFHSGTLRETSRGTLKLQSSDPRDHPLLDPNYLDTPDDMEDLRNAVKLSREILAQKAFDPFRGDEMLPGIFDGRQNTRFFYKHMKVEKRPKIKHMLSLIFMFLQKRSLLLRYQDFCVTKHRRIRMTFMY